jgi:two-component system, OmpR family, sensor histidine kinase VicK
LSNASNNRDNRDKIRTVVLYGAENDAKLFSQVVSGAKTTIDMCDDYVISSIPANYSLLKEQASARKSFRYITEIRRKNIPHCKELMKFGQVRHLEGIKTNFVVTDTEYTSSSAIMQQVHGHPEIVYSNVKRIVEQQRYLFEYLWNKAVPAGSKIREIEEGTISHESNIIENPDELVKEISKPNFEIKRKLLDKQRRGEHKGIRYVTNIDKDDMQIAKRSKFD